MLRIVNKDLQEKFKNCIEDAWKTEKMQEYCMKKAENLIELDNGEIIEIEKPNIHKDFCFGYGYCGISSDEEENGAEEMVDYARHNQEYFKQENLKEIKKTIEDLKKADCIIIAPKYMGQSKENALRYWRILDDYNYMNYTKGYLKIEDSRMLSQLEIENLIKGYEQVKEQFVKRIDTYLKKYGTSKVNAWSYLRD